jgi:uncharacterized repeat protein (TIGR01451 family)
MMFSRLLKRKRKSNRRSSVARTRLGLESLEDRRVLAATNLGAITGTVFIDNDGNGAFTAGEQVANAQVQLYEDSNNNNSLDIGTDTLVSTDTTDANGEYNFAGLSDGNFFVLQPNQTPAGGVALPQQVSPRMTVNGAGTATTLIDDFATDHGPTIDEFPTGTPVTEDFAAPTAIGGNREFTAAFLSGPDGEEVSIRTEMGELRLNPDVQSIGEYSVVWDGAAGGFDPTGLGGIDLTNSNGTGFCVENLFLDQPNGELTVRVYTDAVNFSEATISSITQLVDQNFFIPFTGGTGDATFAATGGTGADFTNVGAIELVVTANQIAMDASLENFGVFGTDVVTVDFLNASPAPQIDVEKLTNGNQADLATDADVPIVAPGSTVTWTYQVTNTGTVDIVTVDLDDDQLGAITVADRVSGDVNNDGLLNPTEVWVFQRTGIAITGFYNNVARVEGFATSGLSAVDTDASNYRGAAATIDIEKFTNGNQADLASDADVPNINVGNAVNWTYQVTNTGSIELSNVQVTDSIEGVVTTITNMGNGDAILDVGEVWLFSLTGTAIAGAYENSGTVNATAVGLGTPVTDTDFSHYFGVQSQIDIEKATNNIDADIVDTGPTVNVGDTVTFTYVVTNLGNTPISNVVVVDDAGTPGNAADDFSPTFTGGDTDGDTLLDTTEAWTYEATRVATLGAHQNIGRVTGQGAAGETVTDSDPSNHRGEVAPTPISKRDLLASAFR